MSSIHRITTIRRELESEIERQDNRLLEEWIKLSTKELEHRIRFSSKQEETYRLQGALRTLDDLGEILKS